MHLPYILGHAAQLVTCLTADPGVMSSIPARSHTFMETDHEIIASAILLPSTESFKKGCFSYRWKYVHEVLVNPLVKLAQERNVVSWTDHSDMTIAVDWNVKHQTKQTNICQITMHYIFTNRTVYLDQLASLLWGCSTEFSSMSIFCVSSREGRLKWAGA